MNARIIYKPAVAASVLDALAEHLPTVIADVMQVPGGKLAIVKPEQVSLSFSEASVRDVGSDIRIMIFAKRNDFRLYSENDLAREIMDKIIARFGEAASSCSVDIRIYLMEIGAAIHS